MSDYNVIITDPFNDLAVTVDEENITVTLSAVGDNGPIGYTGSVGYTGSIGFTGSQGIQGVAGFTGSQGIEGQRGFTGSQGPIGYTGSKGTDGQIGFTGSMGLIGYVGSRGYTGSRGDTGFNGSQGLIGYTGSKGTDGSIGYTGSKGTDGSTGYTGSQGVGYTGSIGFTGSKGDAGISGYTGSKGDQGIGYTGSQGTQGFTGSAGSLGAVTTDDITEGVTNLYFTEARVDTAIADSVTTASLQLTGAYGPMTWNATEGTVDLPLNADVTLQIGQEHNIFARNLSGATVTNGKVVRVTGASGNKITFDLASNTNDGLSASAIAVATQTINNNSSGYITVSGIVRGIDTSAYAEGAVLWLGTNGNFTTTKPLTPLHLVQVGWVVRSHATEGSIYVHIQNGYELEELHDVLITSPVVNQTLGYNGSYWTNVTAPLGYTGSAGTNGTNGFTGSQGIQGYTGSAGTNGTNGFTGSQGPIGYTGSASTVAGFTGSIGYTGSAGAALINDSTVALDSTWSSSKINGYLGSIDAALIAILGV